MSFLDNVLRKIKLSDNRKAPRLDSPTLVAYYWDGATPTAHEIQNISYDGFYMLTDDRLRPGTVVTMTLQRSSDTNVESSSQPHLTVMSIVVREGPDGIGFAFVPQELKDAERSQNARNRPADRRAIRKFIEQVHSDGFLTFTSIANRSRTVTGKLADEDGQTLIFAALSMTCLLGFVALATDVGVMMRQKRMAQTAADAAAIAGALELNYNTGLVTSAAKAASAQNGFTDGSGGVTVTVNWPPRFASASHSSNSYVEAIVSIQQPTIFMGLFGILNMTPTARAVATSGGGASNGCVYILSPNGSPAMELQGSFTVTAPNCGVIVDSNANGALDFTGAGGSLSAGSVGVVGTCTGHCSDSTPTPVQGIIPQSDPLGNLSMPDPTKLSCSAPSGGKLTGTISATGVVCYSGTVSLSNVTLNGGTYVFTGDVNLGGNVTTSGATLDINSGTLGISTGTTLNLLAPTSGNYNGIALMQPLANANQITIQKGDASGTIDGIIYAPGAELFLQDSGGDKSGGLTLITDLIVGSLFDKTATLSIQSYSQSNPGTTPLSKIALVE